MPHTHSSFNSNVQNLHFRNTYHFTKKGLKLAIADQTNPVITDESQFMDYHSKEVVFSILSVYFANIHHWLHSGNNLGPWLESYKPAGSAPRIFYDYDGQTQRNKIDGAYDYTPDRIYFVREGGPTYVAGSTIVTETTVDSTSSSDFSLPTNISYTPKAYLWGNEVELTYAESSAVTLPALKTTLIDKVVVKRKWGTGTVGVATVYDLFEFDDVKLLPIRYKDAQHIEWRITYDGNGNRTGLFEKLPDGSEKRYYTVNYDPTTGLPKDLTNSRGQKTWFKFDGLDRLHMVENDEGETLIIEYDLLHRPVYTTNHKNESSQVIYDKLSVGWVKDIMGRWTEVKSSPLGQTEEIIDSTGGKIKIEWCRCGSPEKLTDFAGRITTWDYDINGSVTKKVLDAGGANETHTFTNDRFGLLESYSLPNSSENIDLDFDDGFRLKGVSFEYFSGYDQGILKYRSLLAYDDFANINDRAFGALAQTSLYRADNHNGYWNRETFSLAHFFRGYDTAGADPTAPDYLALKRIKHSHGVATWNSTVQSSVPISYGVDLDVHGDVHFLHDDRGRLKEVFIDSNNDGVRNGVDYFESWEYDSYERLSSLENNLGKFHFVYEGVSNRVSAVIYPNNMRAVYGYENKLLSSISTFSSTGVLLDQYTYKLRADGQLMVYSKTLPGQSRVDYVPTYDGRGRLTGSVGFDANGVIQNHWGYQYDKNNNLTLTTQNLTSGSGVVSAFAYNSLNQMKSGGVAFTSDVQLPVVGSLSVLGNVSINESGQDVPLIVQQTPTGGTVFSGLVNLNPTNDDFTVKATDKAGLQQQNTFAVNVPTQTTNGVVAYNNRGQMTRDGQQFYHWNPSGQLQRITYGNSDFNWADRTEFVYNALAQRVGRKEFATGSTSAYETETIGYIGLSPAIKKLQKPGQPDAITYVFGFGMLSVANGAPGAKHFFSKDRIGSVHGVWNETQQPIGYLDYSPYGDRITDTTTIEVPVGYIGMDWHKRTELMLVKYRVMNPKTGRWLSREPLGEFENVNLYSYTYGDPITSYDPDGLSVTAYFDPVRQVLVVIDDDTGERVDVHRTASGGQWHKEGFRPKVNLDEIPIPEGKYGIIGDPREGWYALMNETSFGTAARKKKAGKKQAKHFKDWQGNWGRSAFRLHPGTTSRGCVTTHRDSPEAQARYQEMVDLIDNTKSESALTVFDSVFPKELRRESRTFYGYLHVGPLPPAVAAGLGKKKR
jgi:RHS repeat-associated protein